MYGSATGPSSDVEKSVAEAIHDAYDMTRHNRAESVQAEMITPEFAKEYAIFGPVNYCVERLREIVGLGIKRLVVVGPTREAKPAEASMAESRFAEDVMPAIR
jgi:hypothetical protein